MNKKFRYLYWLILEFLKKYKITIVLTFLISFILITFLSLPVDKTFISKKKIGLVGYFDLQKLPDEIINLISNPLLIMDEKGNYVPVVLSSWEISKDYTKYWLNLKKNVYWNDGKELTTANLNLKVKEADIKIIDQYKILVSFKNPAPNFLSYLTRPLIRNNLIGLAGKYKVKNYKLKYGVLNYLLLTPNISQLPVIEYKIYPSEEEMVIAYKMGKINMMILKKKDLADSFISWKNSKISKLVDYNHIFTIFFNNEKELFKDKEFKKLIIKAINKKNFTDLGLENSSSVSLNSIYFNPNLPIDIYAPEYLKEYINSHFEKKSQSKIKIKFFTYYEYFKIAEEIVNQLTQVDIDIQTIFIRQQIPTDFDLMLTLLKVPSIEDQYLLWHSQQKETNISHYKSELADKLLENLRLSTNFEEKKKSAYEFQKVFHDNPGAIFLFHPYVYLIERR